MTLVKQSPIPLYYQLVERIKEQIRAGELIPGQQLPSERDLAEQVGVSRMTARQAVAYLVREGLLEVKPGVGTFVSKPKFAYDALHLLGFTEEIVRRGGAVTSIVLEQKAVAPPVRVMLGLELGPDEIVVKIVRLRRVDQIPVLLETSFVPARLCPHLEKKNLAVDSLYTLLELEYNLRLKRARQTFEATIASTYEQQIFELQSELAMILLEGITYTEQDRPVEYFRAVYRGDRCSFVFESRRDDQIQDTPAARISIVVT